MNSRRPVAVVFAVLCLGLSGLILRGQLAAHPPPRTDGPHPSQDQSASLRFGQPINPRTWHLADTATRREALAIVTAQLDAFRAGDAAGAWRYQGRALKGNFRSPEQFLSQITTHYPEFGHSRTARFSPVWTDPSGLYANVLVTVQGENHRSARAEYALVRENGQFRIGSVTGERIVH